MLTVGRPMTFGSSVCKVFCLEETDVENISSKLAKPELSVPTKIFDPRYMWHQVQDNCSIKTRQLQDGRTIDDNRKQ